MIIIVLLQQHRRNSRTNLLCHIYGEGFIENWIIRAPLYLGLHLHVQVIQQLLASRFADKGKELLWRAVHANLHRPKVTSLLNTRTYTFSGLLFEI